METVAVSGRIDKATSERLDALAKSTARSRSLLISEAVKAYVEDQAWQTSKIRQNSLKLRKWIVCYSSLLL